MGTGHGIAETPLSGPGDGAAPKVSVVVPVYNTREYLAEALGSLTAQTLRDIEILVIDDGSTDGSGELARELAREDARIRVVSQSNGGLSVARNTGIDRARGKYVLFVDSDDRLGADALRRCYEKCEAERLDFVLFDAESFCETGECRAEIDYRRARYAEGKVWEGVELLETLLEKRAFRASACLSFIRLDFLREAGLRFYPGMVHEDELFTPLLYLAARRAGGIAEPFYERRVREGSIMTVRFARRNMDGYLTAARELLRAVPKSDVRRRKVTEQLVARTLNAALSKAHRLPFRDKWRVCGECVFRYGKYVRLRSLAVMWFKRRGR